jgi:NADPH-dependent 2,4-dienoyl-CoA reductase/sulfur reductase-like enzyme
MKKIYDVVIIGAGPAGLAAAIEAKKSGAGNVLVIERNNEPGGILLQCIHNGFGSVIFKKDLPGPAYAWNFIEQARSLNIEMVFDTMVIDITGGRKIYASNSVEGFLELNAKAIVLAMGCRERTRAQIMVPGDRPAGIYTAGMVQRLVNIEGFMPGKNFVILGSGDIGMIMARRLTLEGAKVIKIIELLPYLTGLRRNYVQCLQDFGIPLELSTTIKRITGKKRVEAVETVGVDETLTSIAGTEQVIDCDSLILSVGLVPENELSRKAGVILDPLTLGPVVDETMATNVPGIFAAGNVVAIYDLVDYVSMAGATAGMSAAKFAAGAPVSPRSFTLTPGDGVRTVMPQKITGLSGPSAIVLVELRASREFAGRVSVNILENENIVYSHVEKYARPAEMITLKINWNETAKKLSNNGFDLKVNITKI